MKKKLLKMLAAASAALMLCGCDPAALNEYAALVSGGQESAPSQEIVGETAAPTEEEPAVTKEASETASENAGTVNVGSLKGPTSIGLVRLFNEEGLPYSFTMETQADVLLAGLASKSLDIALIPANVASVLYKKTNGGISVIDINTLGVLYMVSGDDSIEAITDLKGRTVYTTGAGSTPEYVLKYLLSENGLLEDVNIEFKSEATEVVALLSKDPSAVGLLPQPFVMAALAQNDALSIVLDMTEEWNKLENGSMLVTGVTVARKEFIEENPEALEQFLSDHERSVSFVNENVEEAAEYTAQAGIIEKAPVAQKAIPYCNIVCLKGGEMKEALSGYLKALYEQDPASVGGELPDSSFYFE